METEFHMTSRKVRSRGFTLTELLVVIGLIAMLISLLMPVLSKARSAANSAGCLSNLRQLGSAWQIYNAENRGRMLEYINSSPPPSELAWNCYWLGALDKLNVRGKVLLCPAADEPIPYSQPMAKGFGNVNYAWSGKFMSVGTVAKLNPATWRSSSYGFNKYLSVGGGGFGHDGKATNLSAVRTPAEVPVFIDCITIDVQPANYSLDFPAPAPEHLRGDPFPAGAQEHWKFLISRHGRGVNVCMADTSVKWVPLEETYLMTWKKSWMKYRLPLPIK
jgi:prepilin-type N-terminal cleavage/methylation domain-containing protein/prepilin-type processing-associated H-X9-DG protein